MNAPSAGLMDFPPTLVDASDNFSNPDSQYQHAGCSFPHSIGSHHEATYSGRNRQSGSILRFVSKRVLQKVFLQETKARMTDIVPPDGSGTKGTFRLWLHPADRRTRAQAFALHLVLVIAFYSMEALRLARRHLLLLPADPGNSNYSRRSVSAIWACL